MQSVSVGGAPPTAASVWKEKNIIQVLDTILFPDQAPTYTIPTISLSASITGNREVGVSIAQSLTLTGTKNDAGAFSNLVLKRGATTLSTTGTPTATLTSDIAAQFGYIDPNNPNYYYTLSFLDTFTVPSGATNWTGEGSYVLGQAKKNNKGVFDLRSATVRSVNAPQAASVNWATGAQSVTGIYPYFWGKSSTQPTISSIAADIAAGNANKVLSVASGTVSVTFSASSEYIWMAHLATYTTKTKWYNTALNNGDIGAGQFILTPSLQNMNSPESYWSTISFKVYISGFATITSGAIEFRNT